MDVFDNLVNYHYFLTCRARDKPLARFRIEKFIPSVVDEEQHVYSFFVPLDLKVLPKDQTLRVTVYDDSYYAASDLLKVEDVTVLAGPEVSVALSVEKMKVKALWPGRYMPHQLVIRYKTN